MKTILKTVAVMILIAGCNSKVKQEPSPAEDTLAMNTNEKEKIVLMGTNAFLEITLTIEEKNRDAASGVYSKYKNPFLESIKGAVSKQLLIRENDVQVLHGFETVESAKAYLSTELFSKDIVGELAPLLAAEPEIRVYSVVK
ncbi:hypothetical protein [Flagellimonas sp. CMM7]|uniref:hypothetical protein n=1 Tax=Flagellimonas sp. CMM7 TaxID=2654676 RepID=UPI001F45F6AA|nr:hypothetical protein [Flagellimonas sp. CMM7]UII78390.1 hypothetical protein LV704_11995 [Flagellimonas sp. CMM7]